MSDAATVWREALKCVTCGHRIGATGVYVSPGVAFCRECAVRVRDVLAIELTVGDVGIR